ncbi:hypothetical protein SPI_03997 [Niveomyces insectorum RCEF 264]|uniref:Uncharacterized protein n=1 Tax=Niveomyces insectorum RCEF 264 TaxID=1081102 RepID=A0A167VCB5_9HYPO|nr:hypothetical protein SPI_03997 [Niveomyces insectorum RCEF 264]
MLPDDTPSSSRKKPDDGVGGAVPTQDSHRSSRNLMFPPAASLPMNGNSSGYPRINTPTWRNPMPLEMLQAPEEQAQARPTNTLRLPSIMQILSNCDRRQLELLQLPPIWLPQNSVRTQEQNVQAGPSSSASDYNMVAARDRPLPSVETDDQNGEGSTVGQPMGWPDDAGTSDEDEPFLPKKQLSEKARGKQPMKPQAAGNQTGPSSSVPTPSLGGSHSGQSGTPSVSGTPSQLNPDSPPFVPNSAAVPVANQDASSLSRNLVFSSPRRLAIYNALRRQLSAEAAAHSNVAAGETETESQPGPSESSSSASSADTGCEAGPSRPPMCQPPAYQPPTHQPPTSFQTAAVSNAVGYNAFGNQVQGAALQQQGRQTNGLQDTWPVPNTGQADGCTNYLPSGSSIVDTFDDRWQNLSAFNGSQQNAVSAVAALPPTMRIGMPVASQPAPFSNRGVAANRTAGPFGLPEMRQHPSQQATITDSAPLSWTWTPPIRTAERVRRQEFQRDMENRRRYYDVMDTNYSHLRDMAMQRFHYQNQLQQGAHEAVLTAEFNRRQPEWAQAQLLAGNGGPSHAYNTSHNQYHADNNGVHANEFGYYNNGNVNNGSFHNGSLYGSNDTTAAHGQRAAAGASAARGGAFAGPGTVANNSIQPWYGQAEQAYDAHSLVPIYDHAQSQNMQARAPYRMPNNPNQQTYPVNQQTYPVNQQTYSVNQRPRQDLSVVPPSMRVPLGLPVSYNPVDTNQQLQTGHAGNNDTYNVLREAPASELPLTRFHANRMRTASRQSYPQAYSNAHAHAHAQSRAHTNQRVAAGPVAPYATNEAAGNGYSSTTGHHNGVGHSNVDPEARPASQIHPGLRRLRGDPMWPDPSLVYHAHRLTLSRNSDRGSNSNSNGGCCGTGRAAHLYPPSRNEGVWSPLYIPGELPSQPASPDNANETGPQQGQGNRYDGHEARAVVNALADASAAGFLSANSDASTAPLLTGFPSNSINTTTGNNWLLPQSIDQSTIRQMVTRPPMLASTLLCN